MAKERSSSEWSHLIHYLRNTMGTIGALAEYYDAHEPDPEQVKHLIEQLKRLSAQSQGYISAFSEFTQPLNPVPRAVEVPGWLRERVRGHRVAKTPAIKFSLATPDAPFTIEADLDLLARAVDAFLDNAADAMPQGGEFAVSLACEDAHAVFRFRNTGEQVALRLLPELGKPFLTMKPGRLGLGLGWARRAAEAHHGSFGGSNVAGGVEFWIKLPL